MSKLLEKTLIVAILASLAFLTTLTEIYCLDMLCLLDLKSSCTQSTLPLTFPLVNDLRRDQIRL